MEKKKKKSWEKSRQRVKTSEKTGGKINRKTRTAPLSESAAAGNYYGQIVGTHCASLLTNRVSSRTLNPAAAVRQRAVKRNEIDLVFFNFISFFFFFVLFIQYFHCTMYISARVFFLHVFRAYQYRYLREVGIPTVGGIHRGENLVKSTAVARPRGKIRYRRRQRGNGITGFSTERESPPSPPRRLE